MTASLGNQLVFVFESLSEAETEQFGELLAGALQSGDVVALNGDLGAGKTRLVRAIVRRLCPDDQRVSSPTFVLLQRYDGDVPIHHFDAYRLADTHEFLQLGVDEIFADEGICLIEWAERVREVLPRGTLDVRISVTGPQSRRFELSGSDPRATELITKLRGRLSRYDTGRAVVDPLTR